ncbi:hypothetical protein MKW94_007383 [Papaver nudicaule]|uniref:NAC domain-containing protein n=1 Tax=Papaver nudicaule TaxID=74823 RepID=A0AA41VM84_PAPNU|nr:hypothetical protein [Papaver nudicaule]
MGDQNLEDSYVPSGFKFAPSDDELISFFLKNKTEYPGEFNLPKIPETNIYEHLPQELLEGNKDKEAYFITQRNRRHAKGSYVDRSVKEGSGHWRMTGSGKGNEIKGVDGSVIGYKNSLKFYTGKNRKEGKGTDWLMNEFVMAEKLGCSSSMKLDDWVISQVYLKKNAKRTESKAEIDCGGYSTCKKMENERKRSRGQQGIEIGDPDQNVRMSELSSNAILNIQHHQENHYQQYYSQQPQQQFEQQQQQHVYNINKNYYINSINHNPNYMSTGENINYENGVDKNEDL